MLVGSLVNDVDDDSADGSEVGHATSDVGESDCHDDDFDGGVHDGFCWCLVMGESWMVIGSRVQCNGLTRSTLKEVGGYSDIAIYIWLYI